MHVKVRNKEVITTSLLVSSSGAFNATIWKFVLAVPHALF